MRWAWQVLRVAGIGIYVHATFVLLPLWVGWAHYTVDHSWRDALSGVGFVLLLFVIVVLHELGHALTARRFGIRTLDITLLPIGGVARLERMPEDPKQELLVALAGPAVNVALAVLLFAIVGAGRQLQELTQVGMPGTGLLVSLMWVNVALAVFNLVPAFPMDGGRILRALLARWTSYIRATNVAASIGRALAFVFGFLGLTSLMLGGLGPLSNPFLVFIGLFIWMGASQEAGLVRMKSALGGIPVGRLMVTKFIALAPDEPLSSAVAHLLGGWQHDFPVLDNGRVVGLLTRSALIDGLARQGSAAPVGASMVRRFPTIEPGETAESALLRLRREDGQTILAVRDGQLVGLLSSEHVSEYLMVQAALVGSNEREGAAKPEPKSQQPFAGSAAPGPEPLQP